MSGCELCGVLDPAGLSFCSETGNPRCGKTALRTDGSAFEYALRSLPKDMKLGDALALVDFAREAGERMGELP